MSKQEPGLQRPSLPRETEITLSTAIRNIYDNLIFLKNRANAPTTKSSATINTESRVVSKVGPPSNATTWRITHNLNTENVLVQIRESASGLIIGPAASPSATIVNSNVIQVDAVSSMTAASITVTIVH